MTVMLYILLAAVILGIDIGTKFLAKVHLAGNDSIPLIKNVFQLTYVENRGAAFGILQNAWVFFIIVAIVLAIAVVWLLKEYKNRPVMMKLGLSFLCAGALGNTIDRIMQGFVVDFFDFCIIDFPVFNVADIFVCLGAGLLVVFFVFFDNKNSKDKDEQGSISEKYDNKSESCDKEKEAQDKADLTPKDDVAEEDRSEDEN